MPESRFEPDPRSVAAARRFARSALNEAGASADEWVVTQIVSELATNAIVHAGTAFVVRLWIGETSVRVEVIDEAPWIRAVRRNFSDVATTGRGLRVIAELARAWGEEVGPSSKTVWCEVPRTSGGGHGTGGDPGNAERHGFGGWGVEPPDVVPPARYSDRNGGAQVMNDARRTERNRVARAA